MCLSHPLLQEICDIGYSPHDIITTFFRVVKLSPELPEFLKLEFIRVRVPPVATAVVLSCLHMALAFPCLQGARTPVVGTDVFGMQEVGFCHMRIEDGVNSRLQLSGLLAKLCKKQLQSVS